MSINNMSDELFMRKMNIGSIAQYEQIRMLFVQLSDDCEHIKVREDKNYFVVTWGIGCTGVKTFFRGHFEDLKPANDLYEQLSSFYLGDAA